MVYYTEIVPSQPQGKTPYVCPTNFVVEKQTFLDKDKLDKSSVNISFPQTVTRFYGLRNRYGRLLIYVNY